MKVDKIIAAVAVVVAAAYFYETQQINLLAFGDPIGPRAFPYLIGTLLLVGGAVLGFETWRRPAGAQPAAETPSRSPEEKRMDRRIHWMIAGVSGWTLLYILAFERAGYVLASIAFLIGLTSYFHPRRWITNAAISVLLPIATYYVFHNLLHVSLPSGILPL